MGWRKNRRGFLNWASTLSLCLSPLFSTAQDLHLSQYNAAPLFLNPSLTGVFYGYYRLHGHQRTQWASVASKPFLTTELSLDKNYDSFGLGAQLFNYRAGAGSYNVLNTNVSLAYDYAIDFVKHHHICLGAQGGIIQKSVDINKLSFGNQYTNVGGGGFNTNLPNQEVFMNSSVFMPDLNFGFTYYYDEHVGRKSDKSLINLMVGFSIFHITQPNESFFNHANQLPRKYVFHSEYKFRLNNGSILEPKLLYMRQSNAREFTPGLFWYYFFDPETYYFIGVNYRNKDALFTQVGLNQGDLTYYLSYDINISSLAPSTGGRGGLEISLTYIPHKARKRRSCPKF